MSPGGSSRSDIPSTTSCDDPVDDVAAATVAKPNARSLLERLIHAAVALFPLALGLVCAVHSFGYSGLAWWRSAASAVLMGAVLLYVVQGEANDPSAKKSGFFLKALLAALLAMSVRSLSQAFLSVDLKADFRLADANAVEFMRGPSDNLYAARYPYWGFLAVVLGHVYRVFGKGRLVYESFNLVCAGITTLALCYAGRKLTRRPAAGLGAGLVFASWPALIGYSSLLTPEHPFVMLFPCAFLTFSRAVESGAPRAKLGWLAATGCLVGLMECFKPVGSVLLVAFLVALVIYRADHGDVPAYLTRPRLLARMAAARPRARLMLWTGMLMLVLGAGFKATKELGYLAVEYHAGYSVNRWGLGETLRTGLDPKGRGTYRPHVKKRVKEVQKLYGSDFEAANRILMEDTRRMVTDNLRRMPSLLASKFNYVWSSEDQTLRWSTRYPRDNRRVVYDSALLRRFALPYCDSYWILVLVLACSGAVFCAIRRPGPGMLSVGLFVTGTACALLLTEVQQRYRSVLASALALLAGYGAVAVCQCLSRSGENLGRVLGWLPGRFDRLGWLSWVHEGPSRWGRVRKDPERTLGARD